MFNGILWILKNGVPWWDLPPEFGSWKIVHKRFLQWTKLEIWEDILKMLSINADCKAIIIDASFIKLHPHGCAGKGGTSNNLSDEAKVD